MAVIRNIGWMGASTALRLGFGFLTFVVLARTLGPHEFGEFMLWLSVATLLALISNYGLTPYLLREIGAAPATARLRMAEVLTAKLILAAVVLVFGLSALYWLPRSSAVVFSLLLVTQLADSLTEFLNVGFRATDRFDQEARLTTVSVCVQFFTVLAAVYWTPDATHAAAAFLLSRLMVLALTANAQRKFFKGLHPASAREGIAVMLRTRSYAVDFGFQSLFGNVDGLVLTHLVGPAANGIYQAGMRLFNGGAQAATIVSTVFLPRAAAAVADPLRFRQETGRVHWVFLAVGLSFGLCLAIMSHQLVRLLYGEAYAELASLLPWLGLLFCIRLFASSWGMLLTSAGAQRYRAVANGSQWVLVALLVPPVVAYCGAVGWVICLCAGSFVLGVLYMLRGMQVAGGGWLQFLMTIAGCLFFIPWLSLTAR